MFEIEGGAVRVFPGNYEDYLWRKQALSQPPREAVEKAATSPAPVLVKKEAKDRRLNPIKLRQMRDRRRAIEDEVTRLEAEIADYERALGNFHSPGESMQLSELLSARRADLEARSKSTRLNSSHIQKSRMPSSA